MSTPLPPAWFGPAPTRLYYRGYQLCEGCSNGRHHLHAAAIRCDCDICCDDPSEKPRAPQGCTPA